MKNKFLTGGILVLGFVYGFLAKGLFEHRERARVDPSWVQQARLCWPALSERRDDQIAEQLSRAPTFRATFPQLADQTDSVIQEVLHFKAVSANASMRYFDPQGTVRNVPAAESDAARLAGGEIAAKSLAGDGKATFIPVERLGNRDESKQSWLIIRSCLANESGLPKGFPQ